MIVDFAQKNNLYFHFCYCSLTAFRMNGVRAETPHATRLRSRLLQQGIHLCIQDPALRRL